MSKKRITVIGTSQGLEKAEKAMLRLGFNSKFNFAKSQLLARSTVTKFFRQEPIQLDSFQRICNSLKLNWKEIVEMEEPSFEQLEINEPSSSNTNEGTEQVQTLRRQVTIIDEQSKTIKAAIVLEGDIDSIQNFKILQSILREYSGNTIKIIDIKKGSIRLIVEGSQEDIELLVSRIQSGELIELNCFPVEGIQILSE